MREIITLKIGGGNSVVSEQVCFDRRGKIDSDGVAKFWNRLSHERELWQGLACAWQVD